MKRLIYILLSGLMLLVTSCMKDIFQEIDNGSRDLNGEKVEVTFSVDFAGREYDGWGNDGTATKSFGEMNNTKRNRLKLRVYVFDEYGLFTEYADAEITNPQPETIPPDNATVSSDETVFSVELSRSRNARRLHFVAVDDNTYSVSQAYSYGSEGTFMRGLSVGGDVDAYWARMVLDEGISDETHFRRIPLLRNFAKITLACEADNFEPDGFTIVNVPSKGSVAPYNTSTGGFATFYTITNNGGNISTSMVTYKALLNTQNYKGYRPLSSDPLTDWKYITPTSGTGNSGLSFNEVTKQQNGDYVSNPFYMYESPNSYGDEKGKTFMIVRGKYGNSTNDTYYKIDITYKETEGYDYTQEDIANGAGVSTFYNIYRNFNYVINIRGVAFEGYSSAFEAANKPAANNISASVLAEGVNNVSDGNDYRRLFVNQIYALYNEGGEKANLKTKAYTYDNLLQNVKIMVLEEDEGIFAGGEEGRPHINNNAHDGEDYSPILFTLANPGSTPKSAVIRVYINEAPTYETLFRDITVVSRPYYPLRVDCTDVVPVLTGSSLNAKLLVPDGISKNLFPLSFMMEPESKTVYPDASKNQLPVNVGKSILPGHSEENSFQYIRTITYAEYEAADTKAVEGTNFKLLDVWFKTNTASSKTKVYAYNEYFVKAYDEFKNGDPVFLDGDLAVARVLASDYYGAENSYNYVEFKTVRASGSVNISLTEEGAAAQTKSNYSLASATDRTYDPVNKLYTYKVPFLTQTFKGKQYSATVVYSDEYFTQTISGSATQERRYLFLPVGSFAPSNLTERFGATERFKSGIIYDPDHFSTVDPANCGKIAFNASGTTEIEKRVSDADTGYEGYKFGDNAGYHIGVFRQTAFYTSLNENWKLRFYHSTSGAGNAPDDGSHTWRDDWYAEVTIGDLVRRHAVDFQRDQASQAHNASGLDLWTLTFQAP